MEIKSKVQETKQNKQSAEKRTKMSTWNSSHRRNSSQKIQAAWGHERHIGILWRERERGGEVRRHGPRSSWHSAHRSLSALRASSAHPPQHGFSDLVFSFITEKWELYPGFPATFYNLAAVKRRRSGFVFLLRRLGVILVSMQSFKEHLNGVSQPPYFHLHYINHPRLLLTPASFTPWLHPVSISRFCLSPESPYRTWLLCVWTPYVHTHLHHQIYTICSSDYH